MKKKKIITVLRVIFVICFSGCVAIDEKNQGFNKSVISNIDNQVRKPFTRSSASTNMKLEDYAIYRRGGTAQRENREVLVDNFIRGLGVGGF